MNGIPSPWQDEILKDLSTDKAYFDAYENMPATATWLRAIGAALGKTFGVKVVQGDAWEIDFPNKEMRTGNYEKIYTRRGVLGLLMNGIGRVAFGRHFPRTTQEAQKFAADNNVQPELAKHFGALAQIIDEIRTDDTIANEYAGGARVVSTMHAQAYEGANEQIRMMAMDMRARREMARIVLEYLDEYLILVREVAKLPIDDESSKAAQSLRLAARKIQNKQGESKLQQSLRVILSESVWWNRIGNDPVIVLTTGRRYAALLMAYAPTYADEISRVLVFSYKRNQMVFGEVLSFAMISRAEEAAVRQSGDSIRRDIDEIKMLASHSGGHAQYVLAKTEQYYHAHVLGISVPSPFYGDMEAKLLDIEAANQTAFELSQAIIGRGITKDVQDSLDFTKELLPMIEQYPFLDLNDGKKPQQNSNGSSNNGSMGSRVAGAGNQPRPKEKRKKEREQKSASDRSQERRRMEAMDNQKNQEEVDQQRRGYSIFGNPRIDPLKGYLYIIGPYLSRIATTSAKMRRILKVNDPAGLRGAYRRGKGFNTKLLYRHRLNDFKVFARREIDKNLNYGFVLMGDLSGSTESTYGKGNRMIQDEILASAFIITEVAERIGEKVMCAVGFFTDYAASTKRAGFYLNRSKIITDIKDHGGGTNVEAAGHVIEEELHELEEFKIKNKTIVFITDGQFHPDAFESTVKAAKKYKASIAYFSISDARSGMKMCKQIEEYVVKTAQGVRVRTRNIEPKSINQLPDMIATLMRETVTHHA